MNSPETPIYHKKDNLYGQYESRQEIRKNDLAILCEGTTDVISAHQIGIKNIVAPLGTALTKEQLQKISKLTKNVLFLFDSDTAGQKALEKAFVMSQELSLNTYATNTLPYKDIDEMIKESPNKFISLVNKKVDAFTYLLTQFIKDRNLTKFSEYRETVSWLESVLSSVINQHNFSFYVKTVYSITKINISKKGITKAKNFSEVKCGGLAPKRAGKDAIFLQHLLFLKDKNTSLSFDNKFFADSKITEVILFILNNPECKREDIIKQFENDSLVKSIIEDSIFSFSKESSSIEELQNIYDSIVKDYYQTKGLEYNIKIAAAEKTGDVKGSDKLFKEFQDLTKEKQKYEQNSRL